VGGAFSWASACSISASEIVGELDSSKEALVQLDSAPDKPTDRQHEPYIAVGSEHGWVRAERYFGAERLRTTAVALIQ
jgi:hypothetical protein